MAGGTASFRGSIAGGSTSVSHDLSSGTGSPETQNYRFILDDLYDGSVISTSAALDLHAYAVLGGAGAQSASFGNTGWTQFILPPGVTLETSDGADLTLPYPGPLGTTLTTSDAVGFSSFRSGAHWSDGSAPSISSHYSVTSGKTLRTTVGHGDDVFAGRALAIGDNGNADALFILHNADGATVTVNDLTLNRGTVRNGFNNGVATSITLAGTSLSIDDGGGTLDSGAAGGTLRVQSGIMGDGALTIAGGGTVVLAGLDGHRGVTQVVSGTLRAESAACDNLLANDGGIDLFAAGTLQLVHSDEDDFPLSLRSVLADGYANGYTTGQIRATTLMPDRTIGYRHDGDVFSIRVTLPGDADLNASVTFSDLLTVAQNYGTDSGKVWSDGDFNYSGGVDFADLLVLAQHYGGSAFATNPTISASFLSDWALAQSLVPEPTSLTCFAASMLAIRRRRSSRVV